MRKNLRARVRKGKLIVLTSAGLRPQLRTRFELIQGIALSIFLGPTKDGTQQGPILPHKPITLNVDGGVVSAAKSFRWIIRIDDSQTQIAPFLPLSGIPSLHAVRASTEWYSYLR
jgi:hypothetical protein